MRPPCDRRAGCAFRLPQRGFPPAPGTWGVCVQRSQGEGLRASSSIIPGPRQRAPGSGWPFPPLPPLPPGTLGLAVLTLLCGSIHRAQWGPLRCLWFGAPCGSLVLWTWLPPSSGPAPCRASSANTLLRAARCPAPSLHGAPGGVLTAGALLTARPPERKPVILARDLWEGVSPGEGEARPPREHRGTDRVTGWSPGGRRPAFSTLRVPPGRGCPGGWACPPPLRA